MGLRKRGDIYYCRLKINKHEYLASCITGSKQRATALDDQVKTALRQRNPDVLDDDGRDLARRLFNSDVNNLIPGFQRIEQRIKEDQVQGITLSEACEMLYKDPDVQATEMRGKGRNATTYRKRLKQCFAHLLEHLGVDDPILSIGVRDIKDYRLTRREEGAAPATINKEVGILSKIFSMLLVDNVCNVNPCSYVKGLSTEDAVRQVYLSSEDFNKILIQLPSWYKPLALLGYYAGMRAGEIYSLRRDRINLNRRTIVLVEVNKIKERRRKTIPIHFDIVDELQHYLSGQQVIGLDRAFLRDGRAIEKDDMKRPWLRALTAAGVNQKINFHDLRHTWRRNARKSGLDSDIRKAIMGHAGRKKSVDAAYDLFDHEDFVHEIDKLRFDYGETRVYVSHKDDNENILQSAPEGSVSTRGSKGDQPKLKVKHYARKV